MPLDPQAAVNSELYDTFTGDSDLQTLFGGSVSLYPITANKDPDKPYMVHQLVGVDKDILRGDGTYYLDIYAQGTLLTDLWKINRRVKILLTENRFSTSEVKFRTGKIDQFDSIPTQDKNVNLYAGRWPLQYQKTELVDEITSR